MDPVNVLVWVIVAVILLFLLFQARFWSRVFGIEYFDELYTFQNPLKVGSIRDLFISLELVKYQKNVFFYVNLKRFYSIGHEGLDDWSSWIPLDDKPNKTFDDYDIRFKDAWTITIHGHDLHCAVYHGDSTLLYEGEIYPEIRLVGLGIIKFPWNVRKIKKEREFLKDIVSSLQELEGKRAN